MLSPKPKEEGEVHCISAVPYTDIEQVAKYAVVKQARRNKLERQEGEADPMTELTHEQVKEIPM